MNTLRVSLVGFAMGMTAMAASNAPTFNKDVLPLLQKNCQGCHRPGELAPMSLLTYSDARPWAKAMKQAVLAKKMPPWFAEIGHFANDRTLSRGPDRHLSRVGGQWRAGGRCEGTSRPRSAFSRTDGISNRT